MELLRGGEVQLSDFERREVPERRADRVHGWLEVGDDVNALVVRLDRPLLAGPFVLDGHRGAGHEGAAGIEHHAGKPAVCLCSGAGWGQHENGTEDEPCRLENVHAPRLETGCNTGVSYASRCR